MTGYLEEGRELALVNAALRASAKMRSLYLRAHPDAEEGECWAEAEALQHALDAYLPETWPDGEIVTIDWTQIP